MNTRILLTGSHGQLGCAMIAGCPTGFEIIPAGHDQLDITDRQSCMQHVVRVKPDWIVNAAAYTNVEKAEDEPDLAMRVNRDGPANLAAAASECGARLVHISTDFVFDGQLRRPYRPDDATAPLSSYGRSKLAGEMAVLESGAADSLVIRTSWLYNADGKNFVNTILRLLREQPMLRIVGDQTGTPTSAVTLAEAVFAAIRSRAAGLHHWTDAGQTTWHGFACEIQRQAQALGILAGQKEILAISSSEFRCKAARPAWSVLDKGSFTAATGLKPRPWQEMLERVLAKKM